MSLRPLTGMVFTRSWTTVTVICFRPLTGMVFRPQDIYTIANRFSPPYGDGILNISQNTAKLKSRMARKYSLYYNDVLLR